MSNSFIVIILTRLRDKVLDWGTVVVEKRLELKIVERREKKEEQSAVSDK